MQMTILVIEFGIKNIEQIKKKLVFEFLNIIYATSFLDVVDTIYQKNVNLIIFSDYRGTISTVGYIKMFKKTNSEFKLIVLSNEKKIDENDYSYLLQKQADCYVSCYDLEIIKQRILEFYEKFISNTLNKWKELTKSVIMYLKINFKEKSDSILRDLSERMEYSVSTICHSVKEDTGKTVIEWLTFYRVEGAKELLDKTNYPIRSVSELVGYDSIQGFTKSFKKLEGVTPKDYRNRDRNSILSVFQTESIKLKI